MKNYIAWFSYNESMERKLSLFFFLQELLLRVIVVAVQEKAYVGGPERLRPPYMICLQEIMVKFNVLISILKIAILEKSWVEVELGDFDWVQ